MHINDFQGDLTFFTNKDEDNLKNRFVKILNSNTQYFDVLVGYFRTSGFHELYESIEKVEKTRILVGLNIDQRTFESVQTANDLMELNNESEASIVNFSDSLQKEFQHLDDTELLSKSIKSFIDLLISKKIELRIYPHSPLHAKVYIMRKDRLKVPDQYGTVITGSSNFSKSGLVDNLEFNVELKDARDVAFALERFEELWAQSIDVSEEYVNTLHNKSWINEKKYTVQDLFYKVLHDYFEGELDEQDLNYYLPPGFKSLKYQEDAIKRAKEILQAYNGVFISDVVGLGKTYICAMLAQILEPGKKLILCPPVLVDYWRQVFLEFNVSVTVESMGKLDSLLESNYHQFKYVFIDEAHRFRNQNTESYQKLHQLCFNKKIILISATPQNNNIDDLANLIYLFQPKNHSNIIPNNKNLEKYFNTLKKLSKEALDSNDESALANISSEIQDKVLRNIMIRRTRTEIQKYYIEDLKTQNLTFPKLESPFKLTYLLDDNLESIFNRTVDLIKSLNYSRYKPLLYLSKQEELFFSSIATGQHNLAGFMKALIIKRLESSFFAFKQTIQRFIHSYEYAINMLHDDAFYIGDKINVYSLLLNEQENKIIELVDKGKLTRYSSNDFKSTFINDLQADLSILRQIKNLWEDVDHDPKIETLIAQLKQLKKQKQGKILIFSESTETVTYLYESLSKLGLNCISFSGTDSSTVRKEVELNFNPNMEKALQRDDYDILITTDVLAEGINLHRSNIIFNYDLPWNPTKIMQRVGRINRVGTEFEQLYIYNFFPTDQSHEHLSLEEKITYKIQSFHDLLGEDAKYLTEKEVVSSHKIFGKALLDEIDSSFIEDDYNSELHYLKLIRELKTSDPDRFDFIANMPYKVRCAVPTDKDFLLTYMRNGSLKKFVLHEDDSAEIPFMTAMKLFESYLSLQNTNLSDHYFELLEQNIATFRNLLEQEKKLFSTSVSRNPNDLKVIGILKKLIKLQPQQKTLLSKYVELWNDGIIPKKLTNQFISLTKREKDIGKLINSLASLVPDSYLHYEKSSLETNTNPNIHVVLSLYGKKADEAWKQKN